VRADKKLTIIILVGILVLLSLIGLGVGSYSISFSDVYREIVNGLLNRGDPNSLNYLVVWNLRLPILFTAVITGVGLTVAGATMQTVLKNPLADPFTTGISSGACLGATIAITAKIFIIGTGIGTVIFAFIFSLLPVTLILFISKFRRNSPMSIILIGISLMFFFDALTAYLMIRADPLSLSAIYAWTIGTLNRSNWENLTIMSIIVLSTCTFIYLNSKKINALNYDDDTAKSMGINVDRFRLLMLICVSLIAAGITSFTGIIGFIGLVSPHIARLIIGANNKYLILCSMLVGSIFMVFSDIVAKTIAPGTLPIGIVTAMIGCPVLIFLLLSRKGGIYSD
jgi:iron complex transport system permease protein